MLLSELLNLLNTNPSSVQFNEVIDTIDLEYTYTPSKFYNGKGDHAVINEASTNEGSCKILAFAQLNQLTQEQTLNCFGDYYRNDVLLNPNNTDHANIRALIQHGVGNVSFDNTVLVKK